MAIQGLPINGVPREEYGTWCQHGKRLLVPDPTDTSEHPRCIPADPWPCSVPGCTLERLQEELRAEAQEGDGSLWSEVYR